VAEERAQGGQADAQEADVDFDDGPVAAGCLVPCRVGGVVSSVLVRVERGGWGKVQVALLLVAKILSMTVR
jgi:hypothetical protein